MAWSSESLEALSSPSVMTMRTLRGRFALAPFVGGGDDGVVEGGAAGEAEVREAVLQAAEIGSEVLIEVGLIGEVDDEGLVAGIGGFDEVESGGGDGGALGAHGSRVIDEQADGNRGVLMLNGDDGLREHLFGHLEVALVRPLTSWPLLSRTVQFSTTSSALTSNVYGPEESVLASQFARPLEGFARRRERAEDQKCEGDSPRAGPFH